MPSAQDVLNIYRVGGGTVSASGPLCIQSDTTIPSGVALKVLAGFPIALNGYTLTINGNIEAGAYPIFSGTGTVILGQAATADNVRSEWFGASSTGTAAANTAAINTAIAAVSGAGGVVMVGRGITHNALTIPSGVGVAVHDNSVSTTITANDANPALSVTQEGTGYIAQFTTSNGSVAYIASDGDYIARLGTSSIFGTAVRVVNVQTTPVGNVAGVMTNLFTFSLPANVMDDIGGGIRIRSFGTFATNGGSKTVSLLFGSTNVATYTNTGNHQAWRLEVLVVSTGANTQTYGGTMYINGSSPAEFNGTSAENDTVPIAIVTQGQGAGASDVVATMQLIEYMS